MRQNSLKRDDAYAMSAAAREKADTADDLIDQLVQQIVGAAGVSEGSSPAETINRIDQVQAHIEQLREQLEEAESEPPPDEDDVNEDVPEISAPTLPVRRSLPTSAPRLQAVPEVEPVQPLQRQRDVARSPKPATRVAPPLGRPVARHSADEVILEALEAAGEDTAPAARTSNRRGEPPRGGRGGGRLQWMLLGMLLAAIVGGGLVVVANSFYGNVKDLLENYWIEDAAAPVEVSSLDSPVPREVTAPKPVVRPVAVVASDDPPARLAAEAPEAPEPLPNGVVETRRTVKTFRVGPDGKILFGPRAGS